eukprot:TRINITY_DN4032_c0_g1_i8.p1 TRINITY_DN4032_c0_g1~~TRINITY_DN4032_c0_g1_i8.p1  ORF type:complete len:1665 (+),score=458.48 TRINITY_DN4032_c0_g1_i8:252-5246(+)
MAHISGGGGGLAGALQGGDLMDSLHVMNEDYCNALNSAARHVAVESRRLLDELSGPTSSEDLVISGVKSVCARTYKIIEAVSRVNNNTNAAANSGGVGFAGVNGAMLQQQLVLDGSKDLLVTVLEFVKAARSVFSSPMDYLSRQNMETSFKDIILSSKNFISSVESLRMAMNYVSEDDDYNNSNNQQNQQQQQQQQYHHHQQHHQSSPSPPQQQHQQQQDTATTTTTPRLDIMKDVNVTKDALAKVETTGLARRPDQFIAAMRTYVAALSTVLNIATTLNLQSDEDPLKETASSLASTGKALILLSPTSNALMASEQAFRHAVERAYATIKTFVINCSQNKEGARSMRQSMIRPSPTATAGGGGGSGVTTPAPQPPKLGTPLPSHAPPSAATAAAPTGPGTLKGARSRSGLSLGPGGYQALQQQQQQQQSSPVVPPPTAAATSKRATMNKLAPVGGVSSSSSSSPYHGNPPSVSPTSSPSALSPISSSLSNSSLGSASSLSTSSLGSSSSIDSSPSSSPFVSPYPSPSDPYDEYGYTTGGAAADSTLGLPSIKQRVTASNSFDGSTSTSGYTPHPPGHPPPTSPSASSYKLTTPPPSSSSHPLTSSVSAPSISIQACAGNQLLQQQQPSASGSTPPWATIRLRSSMNVSKDAPSFATSSPYEDQQASIPSSPATPSAIPKSTQQTPHHQQQQSDSSKFANLTKFRQQQGTVTPTSPPPSTSVVGASANDETMDQLKDLMNMTGGGNEWMRTGTNAATTTPPAHTITPTTAPVPAATTAPPLTPITSTTSAPSLSSSAPQPASATASYASSPGGTLRAKPKTAPHVTEGVTVGSRRVGFIAPDPHPAVHSTAPPSSPSPAITTTTTSSHSAPVTSSSSSSSSSGGGGEGDISKAFASTKALLMRSLSVASHVGSDKKSTKAKSGTSAPAPKKSGGGSEGDLSKALEAALTDFLRTLNYSVLSRVQLPKISTPSSPSATSLLPKDDSFTEKILLCVTRVCEVVKNILVKVFQDVEEMTVVIANGGAVTPAGGGFLMALDRKNAGKTSSKSTLGRHVLQASVSSPSLTSSSSSSSGGTSSSTQLQLHELLKTILQTVITSYEGAASWRGKVHDYVVPVLSAVTGNQINTRMKVEENLLEAIHGDAFVIRDFVAQLVTEFNSAAHSNIYAESGNQTTLLQLAATAKVLLESVGKLLDGVETLRYVLVNYSDNSNSGSGGGGVGVSISSSPSSSGEHLLSTDDILRSIGSMVDGSGPSAVNIWDDETNILLNDQSVFRAGSLNKIIDILTSDESYDNKFLSTFIATYQSFTTPPELIAKLIQRYAIPTGRVDEKRVRPIRMRVCIVIKYWIENQFADFDQDIITKLQDFIEGVLIRDGYKDLGTSLLKVLGSKVNEVTAKRKAMQVTALDFLQMQEAKMSPSTLFMTLNVSDIAQQLTIIEFDLFCRIQPSELFNQAWNGKVAKHKAPHILALIQRTNRLSFWIASLLLWQSNATSRLKMLNKLLNVAQALREINNFNSLMGIVAGLSMAPINRLKNTLNSLERKPQEILEKLQVLLNPTSSFKNYRSDLHNVRGPCLPYLGTYLSDLTFMEDGNPDTVANPDGGAPLINFTKRELVNSVVLEIKLYQQCSYGIAVRQPLHAFLEALPFSDDPDLYSLSLLREPRAAAK